MCVVRGDGGEGAVEGVGPLHPVHGPPGNAVGRGAVQGKTLAHPGVMNDRGVVGEGLELCESNKFFKCLGSNDFGGGVCNMAFSFVGFVGSWCLTFQ